MSVNYSRAYGYFRQNEMQCYNWCETKNEKKHIKSEYSHNHRQSRWLAQPYKGMVLAGLKALWKSLTFANLHCSRKCDNHYFSPPLCKGRCRATRDRGIAKFTWQKQSLSRLRRQLPLHKGATAAAGLLIGKSLSGTTRLAGGFRKNSSFVGVLYTIRQPLCTKHHAQRLFI